MRPLTAEESKLCASLVPVIEAFARRFATRYGSIGYAEFRSVGNLGAVKAVLAWSPDRGELGPYAHVYIWNEMLSAATKTKRTWAREALRAQAAMRVGREADDSGVYVWSEDAVVRAAAATRLSARAASFLVAMFEHATDADDLADRTALEHGRHKLRALVETLPNETRDLYRLMFVEEKSFTETADALGLDRSLVQRRVNDLKSRLTSYLADAA